MQMTEVEFGPDYSLKDPAAIFERFKVGSGLDDSESLILRKVFTDTISSLEIIFGQETGVVTRAIQAHIRKIDDWTRTREQNHVRYWRGADDKIHAVSRDDRRNSRSTEYFIWLGRLSLRLIDDGYAEVKMPRQPGAFFRKGDAEIHLVQASDRQLQIRLSVRRNEVTLLTIFSSEEIEKAIAKAKEQCNDD